jgi:hypothetical protein
MKKLLFILFVIINTNIFSQGVAINNDGSNPSSSAILDVKSTDKGVLIPRMTQSQKNAITSPDTGLLIYQTDDTSGFYYYNGSSWVQSVGPTGATGSTGPAPSGTGIVTVNSGTLGTPTQLSGDITTTGSSLITTIGASKVTSSMILDGTITTADVSNNSIDGTKINLTSNASGDMMYYNGTDWVRITAGTSGQVLQSNGTSSPTWVTKPDKFNINFTNGNGSVVSANLWYILTTSQTLTSTAQGTTPDRSGISVPSQNAFTFTATQACTMTNFRMWISNSTTNKVYAVAIYKYPITTNATVLGTGVSLISSTNITVSPTVIYGMTPVNITPTSTTINAGEVIMVMIKSSSTASQTVYLNGSMEFTNQ